MIRNRGIIVWCIKKLKNNKTGGSDGIVSELLKYGVKYGGVGMVKMLGKLYYALIWKELRVRANEMKRRTYS